MVLVVTLMIVFGVVIVDVDVLVGAMVVVEEERMKVSSTKRPRWENQQDHVVSEFQQT